MSRTITIFGWIKSEQESLDSLIISSSNLPSGDSFISQCGFGGKKDKKLLDPCYLKAERESTKGLTSLSIIATTSPFIGLFGTVVGILEAFSTFSDGVSLSTIAPAISEALIATAMGILVAIPAYSGNLMLKRKAYEVCSLIKSQMELIGQEESKSKKDNV
ncbi:MAG: MotA/TolQ/ExbB proton channel family protein [Campylobacterales bacterium]|nr:MotA/TolQ/ExbB proton channel family protein [Campylobacterales bacterium]